MPSLELDDSVHGWKSIPCPFHSDRAASASYNTTLERFRCHKCGDDISGDGYDVIMGVERCDFATARNRAVVLTGQSLSAKRLDSMSAPQESKLTRKRTDKRAAMVRRKFSR